VHAGQPSTIAGQRNVDPHKLSHQLRGELDWIVMKCLEKDRTRRYESASAFAADVQRYLTDSPVEAYPPSAVYRLRMFARRNRRYLATAGVIAAALVAATAVSTWQAVVARNAQYQAEAAQRQAATEAAIAHAVNDFLQADLLKQVASAPESGEEFIEEPNLTVREALHRASGRIGTRFQDQPLVEAAIQATIGEAYNSLTNNLAAVPHLDRAVALRKAHLGADHPDTLGSMHNLAVACSWAGRLSDAITLHQLIVENRQAKLGPDHSETLERKRSLADTYCLAGQWDKSALLLEELLEKHRTIRGPTHPTTLATMHALAKNYRDTGRLEESMTLHAEALEIGRATVEATARPHRAHPAFAERIFKGTDARKHFEHAPASRASEILDQAIANAF
jgi:tetratricopeptide (TPR) repeat protein